MNGAPLLKRGVYFEPWTVSGRPVIIAVDRHGEEVCRRVLPDGPRGTVKHETDLMWNVLDLFDPMPRLTLTRGGGA